MGVPIRYNLRNLLERKGTTLMTAFGIGLTVAVLVTSIAMKRGIDSVFAGSGDPLHVLVLRTGTDSELNSTLSEESYQIIRRIPGLAKDQKGEPIASPEGITIVNLPSLESPNGMNVTVRGMLPMGLNLREGAKLKSGRWNQPGKREVVVGEGIASRYPAARIGQSLRFGRGSWEVVGEFVNGGSASNSELWTDLNQLRGDYDQQGGSNSVLVRLESSSGVPAFKQAIKDNQRLGAAGIEERDYYAGLTRSSTGTVLQFIGFFVAIVMAVGSGFAAANTMYAAVARRSREIGTLRALGFSRGSILTSFVLESVALAMVGGVVGVLLATPLNNLSAGIGNFQTFSEVSFRFKIDSVAIAGGLVFAAAIGLVGGLLPAWSASRRGIVASMREA